MVGQSVNGGHTITTAYDNDGMPLQIGSLKLKYNTLNGLPVSDTLGVINTAVTYNTLGEPVGYTVKNGTTPVFTTAHTRDVLGRITQITETINGVTDTYNYTYNTYGYLTEVKKNGITRSLYTYDGNGNRLSAVINGVTDTATYDAQDRMLTYSNAEYIYTKKGDLRYKIEGTDTTKYYYDNIGNLLSVQLPNGNIIEYLVDALGRRVGKKINNILVKRWLYQNQLTPIAEIDSVDNIITRYVYGTRVNVPEYIIKADTAYRVISDYLGSVRFVINTKNGDIIQRIEYDEFGNVFSNNNVGLHSFGFAGGIYDNDIKLIRFGKRDYNPVAGRWTSKDPIGFEGGVSNLYEYCLNDPLNKLDPTGKQGLVNLLLIKHGENISEGMKAAAFLLEAATVALLAKTVSALVTTIRESSHGNSKASNKDNMVYVISYNNEKGEVDVWKFGVTGRVPLHNRPQSQIDKLNSLYPGRSYTWGPAAFVPNRAEALAIEWGLTLEYAFLNRRLPKGMRRPSDVLEFIGDTAL